MFRAHEVVFADGARAFVVADRARIAAALRRLNDIAAPQHLKKSARVLSLPTERELLPAPTGARLTGVVSSLLTERDSLRLCSTGKSAAAPQRLKDIAALRHLNNATGLLPGGVKRQGTPRPSFRGTHGAGSEESRV